MELPHRKAARTALMLTAPRLITERLNVQEEHFPVPGRERQLESRAALPDVLPAVQAPARRRARRGEPWGAAPARFPHAAVSQPLRSLPVPSSLSWNTPGRRVRLPGPGSCANAGYLSQVGGRRAGCWQEAACAARYVAALGSGERSRGYAFRPRVRHRRGPPSAQRGTVEHAGHTAFARFKACRPNLQDLLQMRKSRNQTGALLAS